LKFVALVFLLVPGASLACKPARLHTCENPTISLPSKKFSELVARVDDFQTELSRAIEINDRPGHIEKIPTTYSRSSCFNIGFAQIYLGQLKAFADAHNQKICDFHPALIEARVRGLLNEETPEWSAAKTSREKLKRKAAAAKKALRRFLASSEAI
jgi:hypothetical protein